MAKLGFRAWPGAFSLLKRVCALVSVCVRCRNADESRRNAKLLQASSNFQHTSDRTVALDRDTEQCSIDRKARKDVWKLPMYSVQDSIYQVAQVPCFDIQLTAAKFGPLQRLLAVALNPWNGISLCGHASSAPSFRRRPSRISLCSSVNNAEASPPAPSSDTSCSGFQERCNVLRPVHDANAEATACTLRQPRSK